MFSFPPAPVVSLPHPLAANIRNPVIVLRDDLLHPFMAGNKWRKLKYNLDAFHKAKYKTLITFGGAYSNHLVATAAAGKKFGFHTIGIVRGDSHVSNDALDFMKRCGMFLLFITREEYRLKNDPNFQKVLLERLYARFPHLLLDEKYMLLPEGGANEAALKGCSEIPADFPGDTDILCCACGTGSTLAGIVKGLKPHQSALGIPVLKGEDFLHRDMVNWGASPDRFHLDFSYTFGGYAKQTPELVNFCATFSNQSGIPVEPVYTGKLFFGILDLLKKNYFAPDLKIGILHSGGVFDFGKEVL